MKTPLRKTISFILKVESQLVLSKYKPKIIAITGSIGKTSTKDAIYAVISKISYVRKSEKSYNSELGLPLTILGCANAWNSPLGWLKNILKGFWLFAWPHRYPKWLVLEVGVGKPKDMLRTAIFLKTDAVIITAIGETPSHIEFFESRKHLIEEKSGLIKTLKKDGLLILNADDEAVLEMKEKTRNRSVTFGWKEGADVQGSGESISYDKEGKPQGIIFRVDEGGNSLPVTIDGVFGKNHIYASLAALALSYGFKWNMLDATNALENYDVLLVVGPRAEKIKAGATEAGMNPMNIFEFSNSYQAGEFIKTFVKKGDLILIKGSQGMRMERVVAEILLDKKNKSKLLVRQDPEWLRKE